MYGGPLENILEIDGWIVHQTWRLVYVGIKKESTNKWTYDVMNHLMIYLETIIASTFMTYIVDLDAYELRMGDEIFFRRLY